MGIDFVHGRKKLFFFLFELISSNLERFVFLLKEEKINLREKIKPESKCLTLYFIF